MALLLGLYREGRLVPGIGRGEIVRRDDLYVPPPLGVGRRRCGMCSNDGVSTRSCGASAIYDVADRGCLIARAVASVNYGDERAVGYCGQCQLWRLIALCPCLGRKTTLSANDLPCERHRCLMQRNDPFVLVGPTVGTKYQGTCP